jgi:hypothetical protein
MPLAMHSHVEPADEACGRLTLRSLRSAWVAKEVEAGRTAGEVERGQFETVSVLIFNQPDDQMAMFERALKDEANAWDEPTEMVKLSDEEVGKRYDAWRARLKEVQGE